jgi:hypothetical protein
MNSDLEPDTNMAKISEEFASNYLKAEDLRGRDVTLTISGAEILEFKDDDGFQKKKVVLSFFRTDKRFVCNATNRTVIAEMLGDETDEWTGQKITLYPTKVSFGNKRVDAVRVREMVAAAPAAAAPAPRRPDPGAPPPGRGEAYEGPADGQGEDEDIPFS